MGKWLLLNGFESEPQIPGLIFLVLAQFLGIHWRGFISGV